MATELKKIPNSCTKSEFFDMYAPTPKNFLRGINDVIYNCRKDLPKYQNQTRKRIIATNTILRKEIIAFAKVFDYPVGYEREEL